MLFSASVYLLAFPAWYIQNRILYADALIPYEAVFCVFLSITLFIFTSFKIKTLIKEMKK